jgi:hypothetical protein
MIEKPEFPSMSGLANHVVNRADTWQEVIDTLIESHQSYGLAMQQYGMWLAAEICDSIPLEHPGRADLTAIQIQEAIRAEAEKIK